LLARLWRGIVGTNWREITSPGTSAAEFLDTTPLPALVMTVEIGECFKIVANHRIEI